MKKRNEGERIAIHEGTIWYRTRKEGRKMTNLMYDLWNIKYDVNEESSKKLLKEYDFYLKELVESKTCPKKEIWFGVGKTIINIVVMNKDVDFWNNKVIKFLKNTKNLIEINSFK